MRSSRWAAGVVVALVAVPLLSGCGGESKQGNTASKKDASGRTYASVIKEAQQVDAKAFPAPRGRTLQTLANGVPSVNAGLATSIFTPGTNRLAFGVIDNARKFVYGPTVVYYARNPTKGRVIGPVAAPADPLLVAPAYRSQNAAQATDDIASIYEASIKLPRTGRWSVLVMTRNAGKIYAAATQLEVTRSDPTPARGQMAPKPATDTLASANGNIKSIDTRVPPDSMHDTDLRQVVGKKPVALLFATPQLCQTRVCGPVVDIAAQMKARYGDRVAFIHQEVYKNNEVKNGLRPPLQAYRLRTEPWLFTIDRRGRIAARLQGSFGTEAFDRAVKAALR